MKFLIYKILFVLVLGFANIISFHELRAATTTHNNIDDENSIKNFINTFNTIRIPIDDAINNGHQSAAVNLIQRLREFGFNGHIEVVYKKDETAAKLVYLLPPYAGPKNNPYQELKELKISIVDYKYLTANPAQFKQVVELGIMGADDHNSKPGDWKVDTLITLQPFRWREPRLFQSQGKKISLEEYKDYSVATAKPNIEHIYSIDTYLENDLPITSPFNNKLEALKAILSPSHQRDILPVYSHGLRDQNSDQFYHLLTGLHLAITKQPQAFQHGIIIPVLNTEKLYPRVHLFIKNFNTPETPITLYSATESNIRTKILNSKPNEITIVEVGELPKPIFELLFTQETLPGVVAGQNSIHFMKSLGLPYLPSLNIEPYHFSHNNDYTHEENENILLLNYAFHELLDFNFSIQGSYLSEVFIKSKLDKNRSIQGVFKKFQTTPEEIKKDLLFVAIKKVQKELAKNMCQTFFYY